MTATTQVYRPISTTQFGVDASVNECAVFGAMTGTAYATLGELFTTPQGREMGKAQLHAMARRWRRSLQPADADGLSNQQQQQMVVKAGYPEPRLVNLSFRELQRGARERRFAYSVGGNPARINGPSPLKRTNVPHEFLVAWDPSCDDDELLVYDSLRKVSRNRGEVRPASEVREFAFKSDGALTGVLEFPIGKWTQEELRAAQIRRNKVRPLEADVEALNASRTKLQAEVKKQKGDIANLTAALKDCQSADAIKNAKASGWEGGLVAGVEALNVLRGQGPK